MTSSLLIEMAVHSEKDVFNMNPVVSVSTDVIKNLENDELKKYIYNSIQSVQLLPNYVISEHDIGILIRHHCGFRTLKKAALLALPYVINANLVTAPWRRKVDKKGKLLKGRDRRPSGMISAPILIDGVKYLCNITTKRTSTSRYIPYTLVLKDGNGNIVEREKMDGSSNVPHSSSEPTTSGNVHFNTATTSHEPNPSIQGAKVQQNIETTKNNKIKKEHYMYNKKLIRLTESDLHRIVKESVNRILVKEIDTNQEGYYDPNIEAKRDELINKVNSYVKQIAAMVDQYRNEFGDEFIEDDDYLRDLDGFVSRLLFGY